MTSAEIPFIRKRDSRLVSFDQGKIAAAVSKAVQAVGEASPDISDKVTRQVVSVLKIVTKDNVIPTVEQVQDLVEQMLIQSGYAEIAKAYILYRDQRAQMRDAQAVLKGAVDMVDQYLGQLDWRIHENSNMDYSLQGLNNYISSHVSSHYWLNRIYPPEIRQAHISGDFHIHDIGLLSAYCCGWDLQDLLFQGFKGVPGKVESTPAKHFRTALGQIVNFIYTLQGEAAGAQAFSNFDTYLAPFVRYDGLDKQGIRQAIQEFVFNLNIPTRVGFQTPFTNLTMDLQPATILKDAPVIVAGELQDATYGEFQGEMNLINEAFCEVMMNGDAKGRIFTFPIPTYNITKDFDWNNRGLDPIWRMTARYGIPYFANFVNSNMNPSDARSMCCRLRLDVRELRRRGGGLFGSNPLTGSIGVVTINLPRIAYVARTEDAFYDQVDHLMELAKESLQIKRKILESWTEQGLYPYVRYYLRSVKESKGQYWGNHFSTVGLIGMNEACLNLLGEDISTPRGRHFAMNTLNYMRERLLEFQENTGVMYNLEATPGEGTSYRLALLDVQRYPEMITSGQEEPFYTNSTHLPVDATSDLFDALNHQDDLQCLYTGGTVFHGFLGERISDPMVCKNLVRRIAEGFKMPYYTISPTFSICPIHGYIPGEHSECPYYISTREEAADTSRGDKIHSSELRRSRTYGTL